MVALREDLVNRKTRLLHGGASVLEVVGDFFCGLLKRAVEAVRLLGGRAVAVIRTIPLWRRTENLAGALDDADVALVHRRIRIGWTAEFRILRAEESTKCEQYWQYGLHVNANSPTAKR